MLPKNAPAINVILNLFDIHIEFPRLVKGREELAKLGLHRGTNSASGFRVNDPDKVQREKIMEGEHAAKALGMLVALADVIISCHEGIPDFPGVGA